MIRACRVFVNMKNYLIHFRCYMTLTIALSLCRGGSPKGPAGKIVCCHIKGYNILIINSSIRYW